MDLKICSFCQQQVATTEKLIPSLIEKDKRYSYFFFPCCQYYKQEPFLSDEVIGKLYEKEYDYFTRKGIFKILSDRVTWQRVNRFKKCIQGKDILEIGSSTGEFLLACKTMGAKNVKGVEISEFASRIAKEKYGLDISHSTFEDFETNDRFDVIFMFHVIEHVKDPLQVIAKCNSLLNPKGLLILETPNWDSYESRFYREQWIGWQAPFHTFLYSPATLKKCTEMNGFKVEKIRFNAFSNSYTFAVPYLLKYRNILILPFLGVEFMIRTIRNNVIMTIEARKS